MAVERILQPAQALQRLRFRCLVFVAGLPPKNCKIVHRAEGIGVPGIAHLALVQMKRRTPHETISVAVMGWHA